MTTEREREREADAIEVEPEPEELYVFWSRDKQREHLAKLPRVIRSDTAKKFGLWKKAVWRQGEEVAETYDNRASIFVDWHYHAWEKMDAPIYTLTAVGYPGKKNPQQKGAFGGHRHFFEALFYYADGAGWDEQDGVKWEWKGEGIMCVPTYAFHKHHFARAVDSGIFAVLSRTFEHLGTAHIEQIEINPEFLEGYGGKPPTWLSVSYEEFENKMRSRRSARWGGGPSKTTYERFLNLLNEENEWFSTAPRWIAADSVPYENTPQGRLKYLIHNWSDSCLRTMDVAMQEIDPRGRSGMHRHVFEEIALVLDGSGYVVQDGVRYEIDTDDVVCIPVFTAHQFFCTSDVPLRLLLVNTRWHQYAGFGGIEQLEAAPEWSR